jgi:O-antigen ligase
MADVVGPINVGTWEQRRAPTSLKSPVLIALLIYTALTTITLPIFGQMEEGGAVENIGRIAISDLFMVACVAPFVVFGVFRRGYLVSPPAIVGPWLVLLAIMVVSSLVNEEREQSLFETLIHGFSLFGFVVAYAALAESDHRSILGFAEIWTWITAFSALIAIGDFMFDLGLGTYGLEVAGTFRNYGQAGEYYVTVAVLGASLLLSRSCRWPLITTGAILILIVALILSTKRSALVGFGVFYLLSTLVMFASSDGSLKARAANLFGITAGIVFIFGATVLIVRLAATDEDFFWRFENRILEFGVQTDINVQGENFVQEMTSAGITAFMDNPVIGAGEAGVVMRYFDFEVHNTYLKVASSSGILGFFAFIAAIGSFLRVIYKTYRIRKSQLFLLFMCAWLGLAVMWTYSIMPRQRSAWLGFAVCLALARAETLSASRQLTGNGRTSGGGMTGAQD